MSRVQSLNLGELEPQEHSSRSWLTGKSSSPLGKQCLLPILPLVLYLGMHEVSGDHGNGSDSTTITWFLLFGSADSAAGLLMWINQPECFLGSVCLESKPQVVFVACGSAIQQSTRFFSLGIWAAVLSKILPQMPCQHPHPYARAPIQIGNNQAWVLGRSATLQIGPEGFP